MIRFKCSACHHDLEAGNEMASEIIECPNCKQSMSVPPLPVVTTDPLKRIATSTAGENRILSALLTQAEAQTKHLRHIRGMMMFFYLCAIIGALIELVLWLLE